MRSLPSMYNMLNKLNKMLNEIGGKDNFLLHSVIIILRKKILLASAGLKAEIKNRK